jgi:hypothetical protein
MILASGSDAAFARLAPVLDAVAGKVYRIGSDIGLGSTVKIRHVAGGRFHCAARYRRVEHQELVFCQRYGYRLGIRCPGDSRSAGRIPALDARRAGIGRRSESGRRRHPEAITVMSPAAAFTAPPDTGASSIKSWYSASATAAQVRGILFGECGLAAHLKPGTAVMVSSTIAASDAQAHQQYDRIQLSGERHRAGACAFGARLQQRAAVVGVFDGHGRRSRLPAGGPEHLGGGHQPRQLPRAAGGGARLQMGGEAALAEQDPPHLGGIDHQQYDRIQLRQPSPPPMPRR